jgi:hypothetical protein
LKTILDDRKQEERQKEEGLNNFDAVNYATLQNFNKKEAKKALHIAKLKQLKASPNARQNPKYSRESIIFDISKGITSIDDYLITSSEKQSE